MFNIKDLGKNKVATAIRLKIMVQTDRQTESISVCTLKELSNDIWHAYQSWKLVGDEENNIPPLLHQGGGIMNSLKPGASLIFLIKYTRILRSDKN